MRSLKTGILSGLTFGIIVSGLELSLLFSRHAYTNRSLAELGPENILAPACLNVLFFVFIGVLSWLVLFLIRRLFRRRKPAGPDWKAGLPAALLSLVYSGILIKLIAARMAGFQPPLFVLLVLSSVLHVLLFLLVIRVPGPAVRGSSSRPWHRRWGPSLPLYLVVMSVFVAVVLHRVGRTAQENRKQRPAAHGDRSGEELPSLLLITIDTLRSDYVGCYNPDFVSTPNIDRIAAEGVKFVNAYATAPLTLPSHASIFTGNYPNSHGVRTNLEGGGLDPEHLTLAEILKGYSYETAAFVGAWIVQKNSGLGRGFDTYGDVFEDFWYLNFRKGEYLLPRLLIRVGLIERSVVIVRSADEVTDDALRWLRQHSDQRFFLWLHYYDPHLPYDPPDEYLQKYLAREDVPDSVRRSPDVQRAYYKAEVSFTDAEIGRVFEYLRERGTYDSTLIVVTSDHGESLGEHDYFGHGFRIYEQAVRTPLLFRLPGSPVEDLVVDELVSGIDIMPTILDILSIPAGEDSEGRTLTPFIRGTVYESRDCVFLETTDPRRTEARYGIRGNRWKIIGTYPDSTLEMFDLRSDSLELENLVETEPERAESLAAVMHDFFRPSIGSEGGKIEIDPIREEALRALGYIQ